MHAYLKRGLKNHFFHIIVSFSVNLCISGLQSNFEEISENCDFWSKMRCCCFFLQKKKKKKKNIFGSNCSSLILQLNAENRINIRAVFNKIHVFKLFSVWDLCGSDP